MVESNPQEFVASACYTFESFRRVFGSLVCVDGVVDRIGGDLKVTAAGGASIDVSVAAGSAFITGDLNNAVGVYHVTNDTAKAVTIAANGAGSARIDLIIGSVYDSQYIGAVDQWAIEVVQGVAGAGTPAVPTSTRAGYILLGSVSVPASGGTPSVVTDVRQAMSTCGNRPYVALTPTAATSLVNGTATKIAYATTFYIDSDFFSVASSVVTVLQDGLYDVGTSLAFSVTGGLYEALGLKVTKNGLPGTGIGCSWYEEVDAVDEASQTLTQMNIPLVAGDTLQVSGFQTSGGNRNADSNSFTVRKVG